MDWVYILGTIGFLLLGLGGYSNWRRQLKGKSKYDVAEKALFLIYSLQETIKDIRKHESIGKDQICNYNSELEKYYENRLNLINPIWSELKVLRIKASTILGREAYELFDGIDLVVNNFKEIVIRYYLLKNSKTKDGDNKEINNAILNESMKVVFYTSEDDEFSKKINNAVLKIQNYFEKIIRS